MTSAAHNATIPLLSIGILCVLSAVLVVVIILEVRDRILNARREAPQEPAISAGEPCNGAWLCFLVQFVATLLWANAP